MRVNPFLLLVLTGCGAHSTYEESKHVFAAHRPVVKHQRDWVKPAELKIVKLPTREAVHQACNVPAENGKGSHFNALGIHWAHIQDRGCYVHAEDKSWARIYYLDGDFKALEHEKEHHEHGPAHDGPLMNLHARRLTSADVPKTGTRIFTPYGSPDR